MTVIKVRKTPKSAFKPERHASGLLHAQIAHLEHAVGTPPRTRAKRWKEGEAAAYIGRLTGQLLAPATEPSEAQAQEAAPYGATPRGRNAPRRRSAVAGKKAKKVKKSKKVKKVKKGRRSR